MSKEEQREITKEMTKLLEKLDAIDQSRALAYVQGINIAAARKEKESA